MPQENLPPLIKGVYAWVYIEAAVDGIVRLSPLKCEILWRKVPCFSRGFAAVIDAAVTGTRLKFFGEEGKKHITKIRFWWRNAARQPI